MKRLLFLPALASTLGMGVLAQTYYGNGYTIVEPEAVDDRLSGLDAMVFKTVDAYSVQEGLEQLLQGSGWALAGADNADPQIWRLYRQPWPDNKRTLNPMPLARALEWVAGDGWSLVVDPVNRLVSFEVNARYAARPTPAAATVANAPADAALPPATGYTRVSPTNPYTATVSYADSPSYAASHGGSFHDSGYTASANAVMVSPPDYHDGYNPPPRQTARDAKPLRPAATNIAELKTVSAGAGKTPPVSGKNRRKTADSPALLPVAAGEKTTSHTTSRAQKSAGAATATNPVATTATGKNAAAATSKKTAVQAATAPKSTAATATDTAKKPAADSVTKAAATSGKTVAPATEPAKKGATGAPDTAKKAATAQQIAATPATGTKTGAPALLNEKPSATPAQTTATDSNSGENRP